MNEFAFRSALTGPQLAALALIPPAILALYFLKLKRQPLEVPSTYLWHKAIEDLHVNSLWQRLRQSLLLFLQLLIAALALLAAWNPTWLSHELRGERYVFLIDNSASMSAADLEPSRLEWSKQTAAQLIEQMRPGAAAMIVSFSNTARVEQQFTTNRNELLNRVAAIRPTSRPTNLREALLLAAGLANPGRTSTDAGDVQVADALPAEMFIFSDGHLPAVEGFSLGNLEPTFITTGSAAAKNVAISAFSVRRPERRASEIEVFARLHNHGLETAEASVELRLDGELIDASRMTIEPGESDGIVFPLTEMETGVLELRADSRDDLVADDRAWVAVNPPQPARVLLVTPGNDPLEYALTTGRANERAEVTLEPPPFLAGERYQAIANSDAYDLVIFDRCRPETMPRANTLFIGTTPVGGQWQQLESADVPVIIDTNSAHPLMNLIALGDVDIVEARPLEVPSGGQVLVESQAGPLVAIAPREGFEDAVIAFPLVDAEQVYTNWPLRLSFPVFVLNVLDYLGHSEDALEQGFVRPGQSLALRLSGAGEEIRVRDPGGDEVRVSRGNLGAFNFAATDQLGVYEIMADDISMGSFAVNLFDADESAIRLAEDPKLKIGFIDVAGQAAPQVARREIWWYLLLAALGVALVEWYIYNRRVYL